MRFRERPMVEIAWLGEMFLGGAAKSHRLPQLIRDAAKRAGAAFLNSGDFIESSAVDGIHLDSDAHRALGIRISAIVLELIELTSETPQRQPAE